MYSCDCDFCVSDGFSRLSSSSLHLYSVDVLNRMMLTQETGALTFLSGSVSYLMTIICVCRCLEFDEQPPVEYSKQLVLSCLLHCCQKLSHDSTSVDAVVKQALNVESVVHCIRASQNPHTHHHALLLLAHVAGMMPVSLCSSGRTGSRALLYTSPVPIV
jgi:hypothetical protein